MPSGNLVHWWKHTTMQMDVRIWGEKVETLAFSFCFALSLMLSHSADSLACGKVDTGLTYLQQVLVSTVDLRASGFASDRDFALKFSRYWCAIIRIHPSSLRLPSILQDLLKKSNDAQGQTAQKRWLPPVTVANANHPSAAYLIDAWLMAVTANLAAARAPAIPISIAKQVRWQSALSRHCRRVSLLRVHRRWSIHHGVHSFRLLHSWRSPVDAAVIWRVDHRESGVVHYARNDDSSVSFPTSLHPSARGLASGNDTISRMMYVPRPGTGIRRRASRRRRHHAPAVRRHGRARKIVGAVRAVFCGGAYVGCWIMQVVGDRELNYDMPCVYKNNTPT